MRVVVVGAGVFGTWTAHHLSARGADVVLVDAYSPGHSRSSSGDETRVVRCGYGPDAIYSEMARRSLEQWRALDGRLRLSERLWHASGVLWMAAGADPYTTATRETLIRVGMPPEILGPADIRNRFPQLNTDGIDVALLERECGVVSARRAVRALATDLEGRGVTLMSARIEGPETSPVRAVRAHGRPDIPGDHFVFACGAWLPRVFEIMRNRIRPTRQVVTYFGTPPGDTRFLPARMPAWVDFPSGIYGLPDIDGRGVKVGIDEHGGPIDPDADDRVPDAASLARAREWLARRVPALADAPVVESRVCAYENTDTGDFVLDRHPAHDNIWIVGGGSGHGFKHGPAVGELTARMVLDGERPDSRFALANKGTDARRTIY
jgi:glycine/D-amino acid oxidase-like deaminating enzyme